MILLNTPWGRFYFDFGHCYGYSTLHGDFYAFAYENMAPKSADVMSSFEQFKREHPESPDTVLFRLFRREPLHVWNWGLYFMHPKYDLPYLAPEKVQYRKPPDPMQMCTD
jgi:hypothetical protein